MSLSLSLFFPEQFVIVEDTSSKKKKGTLQKELLKDTLGTCQSG